MENVNINKLLLDYNFYPRNSIDSYHVSEMVEAMNAGTVFPPIVFDKKTSKVVDGFHRISAFRKLKIQEVEAIGKKYKNEGDLFLDAVRYNSSHGRNLTTHDKIRIITLAEDFGIDEKTLTSVLQITKQRYDTIAPRKAFTVDDIERFSVNKKSGKLKGRMIPLKRTVAHKEGEELTEAQADVMDKIGGMDQSFYINQVILLLENDLVNVGSEKLIERMRILKNLLNKFFKK